MNELMQWVHHALYPDVPSVSLEASDPRVEGFIRAAGATPEQFARVRIADTDSASVSNALAVLGDVQCVVLTPANLDGLLRDIGCTEARIAGYRVVCVPEWEGDRVAYCGTRGPEIVSGSVIPEEFGAVASSLETVYAFASGTADE